MTRHIHADDIIIAANDTSIDWQSANPNQPHSWVDVVGNPSWSGLLMYRQKPKPKKTVDMWQWAFVNSNGMIYGSSGFYRTEKEVKEKYSDAKLYRIEGSKITVEVDE